MSSTPIQFSSIHPVAPVTPSERFALLARMLEARSDGDTLFSLPVRGAAPRVSADNSRLAEAAIRVMPAAAMQRTEFSFAPVNTAARPSRASTSERAAGPALTPAALFEAPGHQSEGRVEGSALAAQEVHASDMERSLGKVQFTGNLDLHFNLTTPPPEVLDELRSALDVSVEGLSRAKAFDAASRKAFADSMFSALQQRARSSNSGLLLDAARAKTAIADLRAIEGALQEVADLAGREPERPGVLETPGRRRAQADLQSTRDTIERQKAALDACLDRLRKVTGNGALVESRVPTLRDESGDETELALFCGNLGNLRGLSLPDPSTLHAENNPDVLLVTGALRLADSRLRLLLARIASGAKLQGADIFDIIFSGAVGRTLGLPDAACAEVPGDARSAVAAVNHALDRKRIELDDDKADVEKEIAAQVRLLGARGPGSFWSETRARKAALESAQQHLERLERDALRPASQALPEVIARAKAAVLDCRRDHNESRGEFLRAMNRIVYLTGGFSDLQSEAFKCFETGFSMSYR